MMFSQVIRSKKNREEGEKPFWISYADLMTAMMMLFLVVMTFSLLIITNPGPELEHLRKVEELCQQIQLAAKGIQGTTVDCVNNRIDFGSQAQFANDRYDLPEPARQKLREFVPVLLSVARKDQGKLLKQVTVEGYASQKGSYLHNLQLSMRRAETVLCSLFEASSEEGINLDNNDKKMVRDLFLVGGYSFNNGQNKTDEQMRRVEFKLHFLGIGEKSILASSDNTTDFGKCQ